MNDNNPWKAAVLTALGMAGAVFAWQFLTHSSSDLQALFVGFGFGGLAGYAAGWFFGLMHSPEPAAQRDQVAEAYSRGYSAGLQARWHTAITQEESVVAVVVPTRQMQEVR
jgi:hypothetical protein